MRVTQQTTQVNLQRALIIGLGGTGAEVLVRTRRLLINQFGGLEYIPIVRFLYIDTDPSWWNEQVNQVERNVRLTEMEHLNVQVEDATDLYRGIKSGNYPNYSWFSIESLSSHTNITNGAGAVRQLGRLCFWHHYPEIRDRLMEIINDLAADRNARFMQDRYGIQVDQGINVHIIAGLAGGTGSGMVLDLAYLARKILGSLGVAGSNEINGYLILPQAFQDLQMANSMANGYATLKELNYYSYHHAPDAPMAPLFGKPIWQADYMQNESDRVYFEGHPPFDHCYLLDTRNAFVNVSRSDIFAILARALFHEFTLDFATFKRSLRANIRQQLTARPKDMTDYPMYFMSFGQSSVLFPHRDVRKLFAHQLALQAVQQWIDNQAAPLRIYAGGSYAILANIKQTAESQQTVDAVRNYLIRDMLPNIGLKKDGVLASIVQYEQEKLTDLPYGWREAEKERWVAEKWPFDAFIGHVTDTWRVWRDSFSDEDPNRMKWGERIRTLEEKKGSAFNTYLEQLRNKVYALFEDTTQYGPAYALCAVRQLQSALGRLAELFIKEANDPVAIANSLGDVYLINKASGGGGPSLSPIIEERIGKELSELRKAVESLLPIGKRERVEREAYEYLTWCAHWCRARVEERSRRLAAELADQLKTALVDLERELENQAAKLEKLQQDLLERAKAWYQKATTVENVGETLCDPAILSALESNIGQRQDYNPNLIATRAIERVGKSLREIRDPEEISQLLDALVEAAEEAVGELDEKTLANTRFAAYDLLCAKHSDDNSLQQALRDAYQKASPYVRLGRQTPDGGWNKDNLLETDGVGLFGGGAKDNDPDREHARVVQALFNIGVSNNSIKEIEDSSQIVFFQECGGFPLRALQGLEDMKKVYEERSKFLPLHIVRDEMAMQYPDLFPPDSQNYRRALVIKSVGIPLGILQTAEFLDTSDRRVTKYAYVKEDPVLGKTKRIPISETLEGVAIQLAFKQDLLRDVELAIEQKMKAATPEQKEEYRRKLLEHLSAFEEQLRPIAESKGVEPEDMKEYQEEENRIRDFIQKWLL
jgi:hypothetical protein